MSDCNDCLYADGVFCKVDYEEDENDNCLSFESRKTYEQGRADQKKEDNEFFNFDKVIEIEKNKSYQQGAREFADRLKSDAVNGTGDMEKLLDDCVSLSNSSATFLYVNYIDEVLAEWQKEQHGNP